MTLSVNYYNSERKYLKLLEDFFTGIWTGTNLHSHDITHHRRVWGYAKDLLQSSDNEDITKECFIDKLLIGCYLHDTGMAEDTGPRHGMLSRRLCEKFLTRNGIAADEFADMLDAVENHDDKEYTYKSGKNLLLTFLTVADDLDAFGYIGIYRYSEIYLIRGTDPKEIGWLINANASGRFDNFTATFRKNAELTGRHNKRFRTLSAFFEEYNKQSVNYRFGRKEPQGICGIMEIFQELSGKDICMEDYLKSIYLNSKDSVIKTFFSKLIREINYPYPLLRE